MWTFTHTELPICTAVPLRTEHHIGNTYTHTNKSKTQEAKLETWSVLENNCQGQLLHQSYPLWDASIRLQNVPLISLKGTVWHFWTFPGVSAGCLGTSRWQKLQEVSEPSKERVQHINPDKNHKVFVFPDVLSSELLGQSQASCLHSPVFRLS